MQSRHLTVLIVVLAVLLTGVGVWLLQVPDAPRVDRDLLGPMVQMVRPDAVTLVWTDAKARPAKIEIRAGEGDWTEAGSCEPADGQCEVEITGLEVSTEYSYRIIPTVESESAAPLAEAVFSTSPTPDEPFRILAFGDSGWGGPSQYGLAEVMTGYEPDVIIHTGDVIYDAGAAEDYPAKFYLPYAELIKRVGFYPCDGNHDWDTYQAEPMFDNFVLPRNGPEGTKPEMHYWFDFGGVRFVAIDSNQPFSQIAERVGPWLDEVLADPEPRWKIMFFHHPVYTHSKHSPSGKLREVVVPRVDRYHVAMVLAGHNHLYERTHPLRDGKLADEGGQGTVYVTTGAGGAALYEAEPDPPEQLAVQIDGQYSFTIIDVTDDGLSLQQINLDNEVIDTFQISRPTESPPAVSPATATAAG